MISFVGRMNVPNYKAESTDLSGGILPGVTQAGLVIYFTDTKSWKIVVDGAGTLADYVLPMNVTIAGDIEVGSVEIKNSTDDTRATVDADGLWVRSVVRDIDQPLDSARNLAPYFGEQNVASSGIAEPLLPSATYAAMILVWGKSTNVGEICFGTAAVNKISSRQIVLSPGSMTSIDVPLAYRIGIHQFYVDADNNNDGVQFFYMK